MRRLTVTYSRTELFVFEQTWKLPSGRQTIWGYGLPSETGLLISSVYNSQPSTSCRAKERGCRKGSTFSTTRTRIERNICPLAASMMRRVTPLVEVSAVPTSFANSFC